MEPAEIDWNNISSHYELDEVFERINAPKWLDFSAPDAAIDDSAWFCRTDCRHPITYEDFDRWSPSPKVKLLRSNSDAIRDGEGNIDQRDAHLKRRGGIISVFASPNNPKLNSRRPREDLENQNPNMEATPLMMKGKKMTVAAKKAIKSSAEKKGVVVEEFSETQRERSPPQPRLKSTFSARNLFSGKDILSQISEFCHELRKLASGKDKASILEEEKGKMRKMLEEEGEGTSNGKMEEKMALISTIKTDSLKKKCELTVKFDGSEEKKNKILKEARAHPPTPQRFPSPSNHNNVIKKTSSLKKKCELTVKFDGSEEKKNKILKEARAHPPTPQRFPSPSIHRPQLKNSKASENSSSSSSPFSKISKSNTPERGVLKELERKREKKIELVSKNEECSIASVATEAEGSTLDLFWFLRPCTYLS